MDAMDTTRSGPCLAVDVDQAVEEDCLIESEQSKCLPFKRIGALPRLPASLYPSIKALMRSLESAPEIRFNVRDLRPCSRGQGPFPNMKLDRGMGEVGQYRVSLKGRVRNVVVKWFDVTNPYERFQYKRERNALRKLRGKSGVVTLLGIGSGRGRVETGVENIKISTSTKTRCIATKAAVQGSLRQFLGKSPSGEPAVPDEVSTRPVWKVHPDWTWGTLQPLMVRVAKTIAVVHAEGIIHLDVKLQNVVVKRSGKVKLIDFSFSREVGEKAPTRSELTASPGYAAPELVALAGGLKNDIVLSTKADVFSFGTILAVATGGANELRNHSRKRLFSMTVRGERFSLSENQQTCPPQVRNIIQSCWTQNPASRPSIEKVIEMLEACSSAPMLGANYSLPPFSSSSSSSSQRENNSNEAQQTNVVQMI